MSKRPPKILIIDCSNCEAKVTADILHQYVKYFEEIGEPFQYTFLKCQVCEHPMVSVSDFYQYTHDEYGFENPTRVWPNPEEYLPTSIPSRVRDALVEAQTCCKAKAYTASAVMCGRAIEFMCQDHKIKATLLKGLEELRDKKIIDGKLYEWGNTLREKRNIAAHANDIDISKLDAIDLLDFTKAICNYVYVLSDKYQKFQERQAKEKPSSS